MRSFGWWAAQAFIGLLRKVLSHVWWAVTLRLTTSISPHKRHLTLPKSIDLSSIMFQFSFFNVECSTHSLMNGKTPCTVIVVLFVVTVNNNNSDFGVVWSGIHKSIEVFKVQIKKTVPDRPQHSKTVRHIVQVDGTMKRMTAQISNFHYSQLGKQVWWEEI